MERHPAQQEKRTGERRAALPDGKEGGVRGPCPKSNDEVCGMVSS